MSKQALSLRDRFSICPLIDSDIDVGGFGWVGLSHGGDEPLRLNVAAAVIAHAMGYASIDGVKRKLAKSLDPVPMKDSVARSLLNTHKHAYDEFYRAFTPRSNARIGIFAFDLAMVRSMTSLDLMLAAARQGFLLEPCLIGRAVVEQFSYAKHVWFADDDETIFRSKPQSLIAALRPVNPQIGKAYGLLSALAHYDPNMHYSFIGGSAESNMADGSTVVQRSWLFKIASIAWFMFVLELRLQVFKSCYSDTDNWHIIDKLSGTVTKAFDIYFNGVDLPSVLQVRKLID